MDRRTAREKAFKLLFQLDINDDDISYDETLNSFTKILVHGVKENKEEIDSVIRKHLENWSFDRIAIAEKTILRIAVYEILYVEDIPEAVSINEAVELAHLYGDEKSSKFINGVLSKVIA